MEMSMRRMAEDSFNGLFQTLNSCKHEWVTQGGAVIGSDPPDFEGLPVIVTRCEKCGTSIVRGLDWDDGEGCDD